MDYWNENCVILLLVFLSFVDCAPLAMPSTSRMAFPPPSIPFTDKKILSLSDLEQSYSTLSRTAVTRDALFADVMSERNKFISIDSRQDLNVPIDETIRNRPIGTYQYEDKNGDLHIVNYINDSNGFKILNDYKPYAFMSRNNFPNVHSVDTQNNEINKSDNKASTPAHNNDDSNGENIDWDEVEFTFIPQKSVENKNIKNKDQNYDLIAEENNKNLQTTTISNNSNQNSNSQNSDNRAQLLFEVMNSIPLPQPFTVPNLEIAPSFLQRPDEANNNWREPPIPLNLLYGMSPKNSAANLGPQQFHNILNWN